MVTPIYVLIVCVAAVLVPNFTYGITTDYLNLVCNASSKAFSTSLRLESNTRLYYSADTSCYYHVVTDVGKQVLLLVRKFRLENLVQGSCVDYVNIHDGADISATTINSSPVCGTSAASNYTSTGNEMTVYFQTDTTGSDQGFDFIFVAITTGTCTSSQFTCVNTSVCIDSSLVCSTVDECGDNLDENNCVYSTQNNVDTSSNTGLIAGAIIGGFVFLVICIVVGVHVWKYVRWRFFHARPIKAKDIEFKPTTYQTTYPVTRLYYKEKHQDVYQDPVKAAKSTTHVASTSASTSDHVTGIQTHLQQT